MRRTRTRAAIALTADRDTAVRRARAVAATLLALPLLSLLLIGPW